MERLNCLRCAYRHEDNGNCMAAGGFCTAVPAAHCRLLQEYLGTGLTPEEVPTAVEMAQIYSIIEENKRYRALNVTVDRIKELAKADREGRVVVLPCKVGDTVYVNGWKRTVQASIDEAHIDDIKSLEYLVSFECESDCDGCPFYAWRQYQDGEYSCDGEYGQASIMGGDFGKTVFLTREEAEEALRRAENGNC